MWLSKPPAGIQLNRNHPLAQGLVGCWLFNEGAGLRVNDLTGNNNTGTLTNFEPFTTTKGWTGGKFGNAIQFDGTGTDFISVPSNTTTNIGIGPVTISAWILLTSLPGAANRIITRKDQAGAPRQFYGIVVRNTNMLGFDVYFTGFRLIVTGATSLTTYIWYHCVGIRDASNSKGLVYLNGKLDGNANETTPLSSINPSDPLSIGNDSSFLDATVSFPGKIENVMLWNRVLNSTEVQQLYAQPYSMFWNPSERIRKNYDDEILI